MSLSIERIEILLLIAAVVAMMARRVRLPYTVGLVLAGLTEREEMGQRPSPSGHPKHRGAPRATSSQSPGIVLSGGK